MNTSKTWKALRNPTSDASRQTQERDRQPENYTLTVQLGVGKGERAYPIIIGSDLLEKAESFFPEAVRGRPLAIICDTNTGPLFLGRLRKGLNTRTVTVITIPAGEKSKSLATIEKICTQLLEAGHGRDSVIIALGGGVVGDIAGFVAASYQRGVDFIQIPSTLLAQVDSSVGGKTGVNLPLGKNMVGAFHQPAAVLSDLKTLGTLPRREVSSGLAEIIKHALIDSPDSFAWLEKNIRQLMMLETEALRHAVRHSCGVKARIVAEDEKEQSGKRALLNLGHTFAHAFETISEYQHWLHGEAVGCGLLMAARLSSEIENFPVADVARIESLLTAAQLPTVIPEHWHEDLILQLMTHDKKAKKNRPRFVLMKAIGSARLNDTVTDQQIKRALAKTPPT